MSRLASLTLLLALGNTAACFSERLPPPAFRHNCSNNADCGDEQSCISGLCQISCTQATAERDCDPQQFVGCINGVCTSTCQPDDDACPGSQSCAGIPGLDDMLNIGVCTEACEEGTCPQGEVCLQGFCAQQCDPNDRRPCAEGNECFGGVCVPEDVIDSAGGPPATATASETDATQGTSGDTE